MNCRWPTESKYVALEERVFTVGEVVEYREGAFVRGGFVGGRVLFKDGSFSKNVARRDGAGVRGEARLKERCQRAVRTGEYYTRLASTGLW
jgi:hypothetical protein